MRPVIAFYACMKSPYHPVPSGDRKMARLLMRVFEYMGYEIDFVSEFSSWEGKGCVTQQKKLQEEANHLITAYLQEIKGGKRKQPSCFVSYHVYYKSPDLLGAPIAKHLGCPYYIIEGSDNPKHLEGPWAYYAQLARQALAKATHVFAMSEKDYQPLIRIIAAKNCSKLPPFLAPTPECKDIDSEKKFSQKILLTTAMMRDGPKYLSYKILAEIYQKLARTTNFHGVIIGDGPKRSEIEALFSGINNLQFLGECDDIVVQDYCKKASLFVWPAVKEAYGMAILEAQSYGCPVIAGNQGGVAEIVAHHKTGYLLPLNPDIMANHIKNLLEKPHLYQEFSYNAYMKVQKKHSLAYVASCLSRVML